MTIAERIAFHRNLSKDNQRKAERLKKQLYANGTTRLAVFLLCATCIYFCLQRPEVLLLVASAATIVLFAWFIKRHGKIRYRKELAETMTQIAENELKAFWGNYSAFDGAPERINPAHDFSFDLDIFGDKSIFQQLNRSCISMGKDMLADMVEKPLIDADEICARQAAIKELSGKEDFASAFAPLECSQTMNCLITVPLNNLEKPNVSSLIRCFGR